MSKSSVFHEDHAASITRFFVKELDLCYERDKHVIEHLDGCYKQIVRLQEEFVKMRDLVTESTNHALYGWPDEKEGGE